MLPRSCGLWGGGGCRGAHPGPAQGLPPTRGPVSPQSDDNYHCESDSQCRPERFPGGGEWSPFPALSQPHRSSQCRDGGDGQTCFLVAGDVQEVLWEAGVGESLVPNGFSEAVSLQMGALKGGQDWAGQRAFKRGIYARGRGSKGSEARKSML